MKHLYKIKSISHTGTRGEKGTPRTGGHDGQFYDEWTGMTIWYNPDEAMHGVRFLHYYKSNKGEDITGWMYTSKVEKETVLDNGDIEIVTLNSVYYLEDLHEDVG